jgi:hypothetical protein
MATFSQQFLANLSSPTGMLQGAANLGAAIGGVPGQMKEKRFQTDLAAIDTTTLAGQIEAQQKLLTREKDPRVRLQIQNDISSIRKLQRKEESLDAYIAANQGIPKAQQDLLRSGSITVGTSMNLEKTRKELEAVGELNLTEREETFINAGGTVNQLLARRSSGAATKEQIVAGKGRITNLGSDAARAYVKSLYPDVKLDDDYYSLIGGLKQADFNDNVESFANNNFSKFLRNRETKTEKEKTFYSELANSVDNRFINIKDATAQMKLFKSGIDITVPVEHENIETGEIVKIVKVNPPEGDQYMAKLTGEGNPVKIDINNFKQTTAPKKPESIKSKEVSASDRLNTTQFLNKEFGKTFLGFLDNPDIKEGLVEKLSELANFIQANSPSAVSNEQALKMALDEMKISGEGGGLGDKDVSAANLDVDFDSVLKKLRGSDLPQPSLPVVTNQKQFDELAPGDYFIEDGKRQRKN